MKNEKATKVLIGIWSVTTALIFIGLIVQMALPKIFKNSEFMETLFNEKQSIILVTIALFVTYLLFFVFTTKIGSIENYANKISNKKPIMIIATAASVIFCLMFILMDYSTIASSVIASNNVKTLDGKVEKIQSKTYNNSDEIATIVTVVDSNGQKHKMVPKRDVHLISVFKGSKVHFDYVDLKNFSPKAKVDGTILGYETVSSDDKNEQEENVKGILRKTNNK